MIDISEHAASSFLAADQPVVVARAPGRLDVMGGIADYSGALVLQLPLDRATTVTLQRQQERRCDVASLRDDAWYTFGIELDTLLTGALCDPAALARWFAERPESRWAAYVVGVVHYCARHAAPDAVHGVRLVVESTIPEGRGVSSSAALEVATMIAVAVSYGLELSPHTAAMACQWVENQIVGAPCGIMDQMTSVYGQRDRLLRLRCQPATVEGYLDVPTGFRFYGLDSGVRHAVTGADYITVRTAAFMGYRMIAGLAGLAAEVVDERALVQDPVWHGYLTNMPTSEFESRFRNALPDRMTGAEFLARHGGITDLATRVEPDRVYPVRQAAAHPVYEQARVERFATLLGQLGREPDAALALGRLMLDSHASYSACGLGSAATDRLVELAMDAGPSRGIHGAKITGGGSGGTVAILGAANAEPAIREIAARYGTETGRRADVFTRSGSGAIEMGVIHLDRPPI